MLIAGLAVRLFSYVVRYDSGFAPNPFFGTCTLATCKPDIRRAARVGDWIIGTGSAEKSIRRGGFLVYAMRVTDILSFEEYWNDARYRRKKPNLQGSKKQACGDNIYHLDETGRWAQLDSFHSERDGSPSARHIQRDTGVDRILASNDFVYFGGHGPAIPTAFRTYNGNDICKKGQGRKIFEDRPMVEAFVSWLRSLGLSGYVADPYDWERMP